MATNKQQIEETLSSLDNVHRAEANPLLFEKIMQRMEKKPGKVYSLKPALAWSAAACLALIIGLNILTCLNYSKSIVSAQKTTITNTGAGSASPNPIISDYFSYTNSYQY